MAKKLPAPEAPIVTKLPLPNSDNALVIDLPDGQKLVVGKMATGTVIEVATWRGTGRPDSRTTRLMLGVSSQDSVNAPSDGKPQVTAPAENVGIKGKILSLVPKVKVLLQGALTKIELLKNTKNSKKTDKKPLEISAPATSAGNESQDEVQAWLDSIIQKSESKAKALSASKAPAVTKAAKPKVAPKKSAGTRRVK